ncbi:hypothetical protein B0H13DRAFT_2360100 [Mycena leptocephala]|nr:hypothetical protein B0H13DRAFT_2360100 [Mycena leptocephala]
MQLLILCLLYLISTSVGSSGVTHSFTTTESTTEISTTLFQHAASTVDTAPETSMTIPVSTTLSPCVTSCLSLVAASSLCNVPSNVTCVCTDADFLGNLASCLEGECQPSEMSLALGIQLQKCFGAHLSPSIPPTGTAPFLPSNSFADKSPSTSPSAPSLPPSNSFGDNSPTTSPSAPPTVTASFVPSNSLADKSRSTIAGAISPSPSAPTKSSAGDASNGSRGGMSPAVPVRRTAISLIFEASIWILLAL